MSVARRLRTDGLMILLRLTLVAAGATLAADAVNQYLLGRWPVPAPPPAPPAASAQAPAPSAPVSFAAIVRRGIFNSNPAPAHPAPVATAAPDRPLAVAQPLNLNVRLTGTVVGTSPSDSFAIILDVAGREERLYRMGDKVLGEGTVTEIGRDTVRLRRGDAEQVLRMFEEDQGANASVTTADTRGPEETGPDQFRFVIDRAEVDDALSDMPRLLTQARLLPNFRAGQTDGFRIFNIVPGSIFARIGLKNGDVIHQINDIPIEDPTKFMSIFQDLKDASQINLDLVRGTERKTFEYEIR